MAHRKAFGETQHKNTLRSVGPSVERPKTKLQHTPSRDCVWLDDVTTNILFQYAFEIRSARESCAPDLRACVRSNVHVIRTSLSVNTHTHTRTLLISDFRNENRQYHIRFWWTGREYWVPTHIAMLQPTPVLQTPTTKDTLRTWTCLTMCIFRADDVVCSVSANVCERMCVYPTSECVVPELMATYEFNYCTSTLAISYVPLR